MSSIIIDPTVPSPSIPNDFEGLDIQDFLDQIKSFDGFNSFNDFNGSSFNDFNGSNGWDFNDSIFGGSPPPGDGTTEEYVFSLDSDFGTSSSEPISFDNFVSGEDTIRIEGVTSEDNVDYNKDTGMISINGEDFAQIDPDLPIEDSDFDLL